LAARIDDSKQRSIPVGAMGVCTNLLGLSVCGVAMIIGYFSSTTEDWAYRVKQSLTAVYELQKIPAERINNFLNAYSMFEMDSFTGTPNQMQLVKDYYETLNHLCTIGNYEKMYLPPLLDETKDTYSNQKLFEKRMASRLNVTTGSRVLDIGCGRGRIAHLVASETGADVIGINIDKDQLASAREFAHVKGMSGQLSFQEANYNEPLPYPDGHFDAVYYVQVIGGYGTDLKKLFKEIHRVLKPGGHAHFEDYVVLPAYNATDLQQWKLVQASKAVLGVVSYYTDQDYVDAMTESGLETLHRVNASVAEQAKLLDKDKAFFLPLTRIVSFLNSGGVVPSHFAEMLQRMTKGTDEMIEAHRLGLVTGDIETYMRKPL